MRQIFQRMNFLTVIAMLFLASVAVHLGAGCGTGAGSAQVDSNPPIVADVILSIVPPSSAIGVDVHAPIIIEFAEGIDKASVEQSFSLVKNSTGERIEGTFLWDGYKMIFTPSHVLEFLTSYTVHLAGNLVYESASVSKSPGLIIPIDVLFTFTTADQSVYPQVLGANPVGGSEGVSVSTSIEVTFDQPMDPVKTAKAFSLTTGGAVEGTVSWNADNSVLTFLPASKLFHGSVYFINLSPNAASAAGYPLENAFVAAFKTYASGRPRVEFTTPDDGETNVAAGTKMLVRFSKVMDTAKTEVATQVVDDKGEVEVTMNWQRYNTELVISPKAPLPYLNKIAVSISSDARCEEGYRLEAFITSFTTMENPYPEVKDTSPPDGEKNVPIGAQIKVNFTKPMDTTSLEAAFSLKRSDTGAIVEGTISWENEDSTMSFTPKPELDRGVTYDIEITTGAAAKSGVHMLNAFNSSFTTEAVPPPTVVSISPKDEQGGVDINTDIVVEFDRAMDTVSVEKAFTLREKGVANPIAGVFSWKNDNTVMIFNPTASLKMRTYEVRITTDAMDKDGVHMADPWFSTFVCGLIHAPDPEPIPVP